MLSYLLTVSAATLTAVTAASYADSCTDINGGKAFEPKVVQKNTCYKFDSYRDLEPNVYSDSTTSTATVNKDGIPNFGGAADSDLQNNVNVFTWTLKESDLLTTLDVGQTNGKERMPVQKLKGRVNFLLWNINKDNTEKWAEPSNTANSAIVMITPSGQKKNGFQFQDTNYRYQDDATAVKTYKFGFQSAKTYKVECWNASRTVDTDASYSGSHCKDDDDHLILGTYTFIVKQTGFDFSTVTDANQKTSSNGFRVKVIKSFEGADEKVDIQENAGKQVSVEIGRTVRLYTNASSYARNNFLKSFTVNLASNAKYFTDVRGGSASGGVKVFSQTTNAGEENTAANMRPHRYNYNDPKWSTAGTDWVYGGDKTMNSFSFDKFAGLAQATIGNGKHSFTQPQQRIQLSVPITNDNTNNGRGANKQGYDWGANGPDISTTVKYTIEKLPTLTLNKTEEVSLDATSTRNSFYKVYQANVSHDFAHISSTVTATLADYSVEPNNNAAGQVNVKVYAVKRSATLDATYTAITTGAAVDACKYGRCTPVLNKRLVDGKYGDIEGYKLQKTDLTLTDLYSKDAKLSPLSLIVVVTGTVDAFSTPTYDSNNNNQNTRGMMTGGGECQVSSETTGVNHCYSHGTCDNTIEEDNNNYVAGDPATNTNKGKCQCNSGRWGANCEYPLGATTKNDYASRGGAKGPITLKVTVKTVVKSIDELGSCTTNRHCRNPDSRTVSDSVKQRQRKSVDDAKWRFSPNGLGFPTPFCRVEFRGVTFNPNAPVTTCSSCNKDDDCPMDQFCMSAARAEIYLSKQKSNQPAVWTQRAYGKITMDSASLYLKNHFGRCVKKDFSALGKRCRQDFQSTGLTFNTTNKDSVVFCGQQLRSDKVTAIDARVVPNSGHNMWSSDVLFGDESGRTLDTVWTGKCVNGICHECIDDARLNPDAQSEDGTYLSTATDMTNKKGLICYGGKRYRGLTQDTRFTWDITAVIITTVICLIVFVALVYALYLCISHFCCSGSETKTESKPNPATKQVVLANA